MNLADHDIAEKTARGIEEIRKRVLGLPARLRTILLLVDGEKPLSQLKTMLPSETDLSSALRALMEQELIRLRAPAAVLERSRPAPSAIRPAVPPERQDAGGKPRSDGDPEAGDEALRARSHSLMRARAHLANALDEFLGVEGYLLRQQIAACINFEQLETMYGEVEQRLVPAMGPPGAAGIVRRARALARIATRSAPP